VGPTITYYLDFIEGLRESGVRRNRAQVLTTTWVASAQSYHRLKTTQVVPAQSSYTEHDTLIKFNHGSNDLGDEFISFWQVIIA
jgi:hypothetical protein